MISRDFYCFSEVYWILAVQFDFFEYFVFSKYISMSWVFFSVYRQLYVYVCVFVCTCTHFHTCVILFYFTFILLNFLCTGNLTTHPQSFAYLLYLLISQTILI